MGKLGQGIDTLKREGGLESPYETMFTSTLLQDFFVYFYLYIIYFTLTMVILQ